MHVGNPSTGKEIRAINVTQLYKHVKYFLNVVLARFLSVTLFKLLGQSQCNLFCRQTPSAREHTCLSIKRGSFQFSFSLLHQRKFYYVGHSYSADASLTLQKRVTLL